MCEYRYIILCNIIPISIYIIYIHSAKRHLINLHAFLFFYLLFCLFIYLFSIKTFFKQCSEKYFLFGPEQGERKVKKFLPLFNF